ncbi:MAG: GNAT family N-acetyltransferase [Patescibacteria group bacterium]
MIITKLTSENIKEAGEMADQIFVRTPIPPSVGLGASLDNQVMEDLNKNHKGNFNWLQYWVGIDRKTKEVIGVVGLYEELSDAKEACWLGWFCVRPDKRGRRHGTQLLDFAITYAKKLHKQYLRLYTSTDPNELKAQKIYKKYGFQETTKEKREKEDIYETIYLELALL